VISFASKMALVAVMSNGGTPKKRRICEDSAFEGVAKALAKGCEVDKNFIMEQMDNVPGLTSHLASMLRGGTIQKALNRAAAGSASLELGRKIDSKILQIRCLSRKFKWSFFSSHFKIHAEDQEAWDHTEDRVIDHLIQYALACVDKCALPTEHEHPDYEGPMLAVLMHRAAIVKRPVKNLDATNAGAFGIFTYDDKRPTVIGCRTSASVAILPMTTELLAMATDWEIEDNHSPFKACFKSKFLGAQQLVAPLFVAQHNMVFMEDVLSFEYPDAAKAFEQFVVPASFAETGDKKQIKTGKGNAKGGQTNFCSSTCVLHVVSRRKQFG
jgi:hypothetical protein